MRIRDWPQASLHGLKQDELSAIETLLDIFAERVNVCEWHRERQFKYVALKRILQAVCMQQRGRDPGEPPPILRLKDEVDIPRDARKLQHSVYLSPSYREIPAPGVEWALTRRCTQP